MERTDLQAAWTVSLVCGRPPPRSSGWSKKTDVFDRQMLRTVRLHDEPAATAANSSTPFDIAQGFLVAVLIGRS